MLFIKTFNELSFENERYTKVQQQPISGNDLANLFQTFTTISGSLIELMGVAMGNETTIAAKQNFSDLAKRLFVMPGTENEKLAGAQLSICQKKS